MLTTLILCLNTLRLVNANISRSSVVSLGGQELIAALITAFSSLRPSRVLTLLIIQLANCMCFRAAKCMDSICMYVNKERKMGDTFKGKSSSCAK